MILALLIHSFAFLIPHSNLNGVSHGERNTCLSFFWWLQPMENVKCLANCVFLTQMNNLSMTRGMLEARTEASCSCCYLNELVFQKCVRKKWQQTPGFVCSPSDYCDHVFVFGQVTIFKYFFSFHSLSAESCSRLQMTTDISIYFRQKRRLLWKFYFLEMPETFCFFDIL